MECDPDSVEWSETVRKIRYLWTVNIFINACGDIESNSFPSHCAVEDQWFLTGRYRRDKDLCQLRINLKQGSGSKQGIRKVSAIYQLTNDHDCSTKYNDSCSEITFMNFPFGQSVINCTIFESMSKPRICFDAILTSTGLEAGVVVRTKDKDIPCHEVILAKSPVFQKALQVDMKEKDEKVIDLSDVLDTDTTDDLLHYLYNGSAPNIATTCDKLIAMADLHSLDELKVQCEIQLEMKLKVENVGEYLQLAAMYNGVYLQKRCVCFYKNNYHLVVKTDGWKQLPNEMLGSLIHLFV